MFSHKYSEQSRILCNVWLKAYKKLSVIFQVVSSSHVNCSYKMISEVSKGGMLLEPGTQVLAPIYSEYSTCLRSYEVSSACRQIQNQKGD